MTYIWNFFFIVWTESAGVSKNKEGSKDSIGVLSRFILNSQNEKENGIISE